MEKCEKLIFDPGLGNVCSENCWKTYNLELRTVGWVKRIFQSFLWKGMNIMERYE